MKKSKIPNSFIIVFIIMLLAALMTYIVPAGKYEFLKGTKIIDPNSFHFVKSNATTLWGFISSIFEGSKRAGTIIMFTFFMGGYFNICVETKSIDRFVGYLIKRFQDKALIIIPAIMVLMAMLGYVGIANPVVAFVPVGIIIARKLELDRIIAVALMFCACYVGYSMSAICPVTVQLAQKIAEVPNLTGFGFRTIGWLLILVPTVWYTLRYAKRIQGNPSASYMGELLSEQTENTSSELVQDQFTLRDALVLIILAGGLLIYIYGSLAFRWGLEAMIGAMFIIAILDAAVIGMSPDDFTKAFLNGAKQMVFSALLIGLATSISVILNNANVLHTIIYGIAVILQSLPDALVAPMMYAANILFNFFVPSGSGQAAVVMPIMAPLADVVGISRQMAICAYQYGDGLSNCIFPTNGTMMASLAVAGVKYEQWIKWMLPLYGIWLAISTAWLILGVLLGIN